MLASRLKEEERGAKMNDHREHRHHGEAEIQRRRPDWRRIHHSPLFWVGAAMFLAAIAIYVWSEDLSWRPRSRQE
jgi:Mg2+/citrate symporter